MQIKQRGDTDKSKNDDIKKSNEETNTTSDLNMYINKSSRNLSTIRSPFYRFIATDVKPHIFLTLTCNTEWSTLTENALPLKTQTTFPEIENLTFHQRLKTHLQNLKK
jgi:hypothetical protein